MHDVEKHAQPYIMYAYYMYAYIIHDMTYDMAYMSCMRGRSEE